MFSLPCWFESLTHTSGVAVSHCHPLPVFQFPPVPGVQSILHTMCAVTSLNTLWVTPSNTSRGLCLQGSLKTQAWCSSPRPQYLCMPQGHTTGLLRAPHHLLACRHLPQEELSFPHPHPNPLSNLRNESKSSRGQGSWLGFPAHQPLTLPPWLRLFPLW